MFLVETGESRTPRLDLSRLHFQCDLFYVHEKLVGVAGFELATPAPKAGALPLRHTPTGKLSFVRY